MAVPYCMIHYGKPYLEACGAMVAGVVLGSLSMKTRSIYPGFLVHVTVAILMDILALDRRRAAGAAGALVRAADLFLYWHAVIWAAWTLALLVIALKAWRVWRARAAPPPPVQPQGASGPVQLPPRRRRRQSRLEPVCPPPWRSPGA